MPLSLFLVQTLSLQRRYERAQEAFFSSQRSDPRNQNGTTLDSVAATTSISGASAQHPESYVEIQSISLIAPLFQRSLIAT